MGKKLHLYTSADVTRSVLHGAEITAQCGRKKVLTREDIDRNAEDLAVCRTCQDSIAERTRSGQVLLYKRDGWTGHLEQQARADAGVKFTIQMSGTTAWNYSSGWPLAG